MMAEKLTPLAQLPPVGTEDKPARLSNYEPEPATPLAEVPRVTAGKKQPLADRPENRLKLMLASPEFQALDDANKLHAVTRASEVIPAVAELDDANRQRFIERVMTEAVPQAAQAAAEQRVKGPENPNFGFVPDPVAKNLQFWMLQPAYHQASPERQVEIIRDFAGDISDEQLEAIQQEGESYRRLLESRGAFTPSLPADEIVTPDAGTPTIGPVRDNIFQKIGQALSYGGGQAVGAMGSMLEHGPEVWAELATKVPHPVQLFGAEHPAQSTVDWLRNNPTQEDPFANGRMTGLEIIDQAGRDLQAYGEKLMRRYDRRRKTLDGGALKAMIYEPQESILSVAERLPTQATLIGPAIIGFALGGPIGAGVTSRVLEGTMEATTAVEQLQAAGADDPEVMDRASKILAGNLPLAALDAAQAGLLLKVLPAPAKQALLKLPKKAITRVPVKTLLTWAMVKGEGLEEGYQDELQEWAKGEGFDLDPRAWDAEARTAGELNALLLGGTAAVVGEARQSGTDRTLERLRQQREKNDPVAAAIARTERRPRTEPSAADVERARWEEAPDYVTGETVGEAVSAGRETPDITKGGDVRRDWARGELTDAEVAERFATEDRPADRILADLEASSERAERRVNPEYDRTRALAEPPPEGMEPDADTPQRQAFDELVASVERDAVRLETAGDAGRAAKLRSDAAAMRPVPAPTMEAEALQEFGRTRGVEVAYYAGADDSAVVGAQNRPGVVLIQANRETDFQVARVVLHEMTHGLAQSVPEAHQVLGDWIQTEMPEVWQKTRDRVEADYRERLEAEHGAGTEEYARELRGEVLSRIAEEHAGPILRAIGNRWQAEKWSSLPAKNPVRRMVRHFHDLMVRLARRVGWKLGGRKQYGEVAQAVDFALQWADALDAMKPPEAPAVPAQESAQASEQASTQVEPMPTAAALRPRVEFQSLADQRQFSPEEREAETAMGEVVADFDRAWTEYVKLDDAEGGRVLNVDVARELSPDYRANRTKYSDAVHAPASAFIQEAFRRQLAREDLPGPPIVVVLAGGAASGKTSVVSASGGTLDAQITVDTTADKLPKARRMIQEALDSGRRVNVQYVYRPVDGPNGAAAGLFQRAMKTGRTVPIEVFARGHVQSQETILALADEFADDTRVNIEVYANDGRLNDMRRADLDYLRSRRYIDRVGNDAAGVIAESAREVYHEQFEGNPEFTEDLRRAFFGVDADVGRGVRPLGGEEQPGVHRELQEERPRRAGGEEVDSAIEPAKPTPSTMEGVGRSGDQGGERYAYRPGATLSQPAPAMPPSARSFEEMQADLAAIDERESPAELQRNLDAYARAQIAAKDDAFELFGERPEFGGSAWDRFFERRLIDRYRQLGGTGDPRKLSTAYAMRQAAPGVNEATAEWFPPEDTRWRHVVRRVVDRFDRVRLTQRELEDTYGKTLQDEVDVYMREALYYGRVEQRIERLQQRWVKKLQRALKEQEIAPEVLNRFLYARHAPERNRHMWQIHIERPLKLLKEELAEVQEKKRAAEKQQKARAIARREPLDDAVSTPYWDQKIEEIREQIKAKERLVNEGRVPNSGMTDAGARAVIAELEKSGLVSVSMEQVDEWIDRQQAQQVFRDQSLGLDLRIAVMQEAHRRTGPKGPGDAKPVYSGKLAVVADAFDEMTREHLRYVRDEGLVDEETVDRVAGHYDFYAPLKGQMLEDEGDAGALMQRYTASQGMGFDIRGQEIEHALGRRTEAKNPILAQAVVDWERSIVRAEKNRVGLALLELVERHPNRNLWEVNKEVHKHIYDPQKGIAVRVLDKFHKNDPNVVAVKREGETFFITIHDELLAAAIKNLGVEQGGKFVRGIGKATRYLAAMATSLNPEFVISNAIRDMQTAAVHLSDETLKGGTLKAISQALSAGLAIAREEVLPESMHAENGKWTKAWRDFKVAGGKTGQFYLSDVHTRMKQIEADLSSGVAARVHRGWAALGGVVDDINAAVENAVRVAAFELARDARLSTDRAAVLGKELTVNFNRRGELTWLSNFWMFANAGIQGTARLFQAAGRSKRVRAIMASQFLMGVALSIWNRSAAGEDETGRNRWDRMPGWAKERSLVVWLPGDEKAYQFPLPYGYNWPVATGYALGDVIFGDLEPAEAAVQSFSAGMTAFNPLGGTALAQDFDETTKGWVQLVSPTVLDPLVDITINRNFAGIPIKPERYPGESTPWAYKHFKSARHVSRGFADWLNRFTGGNEFEPGILDISPEVIDYAIDFGGSGLLRVLEDGAEWATTPGRESVPVRRKPFLRRLRYELPEYLDSSEYYDGLERVNMIRKALRQAKDGGDSGALRDFRRRYSGLVSAASDDHLRDLERSIRKEEDEDQRRELMRQWLQLYNAAKER